MYECGKLKKVIGNKFLFPVILEQCVCFAPWHNKSDKITGIIHTHTVGANYEGHKAALQSD